LPTYRCENGSRAAVNEEVAQSILEDGGGGFHQRSNSRNGSNIGGGDRVLLQAMDWHRKLRRNSSTVAAQLGNGGSILGS
jgi:hypothetical protein